MNMAPEQLRNSVLVVDDEEHIRKLVSIGLRRAGHDVTVAANGSEALERISEATPDLIVSDVMMPDMDGFGLLSRLRSDPSTRAVPLIFLTARGSSDDVVEGLGLGADDYLAKPFDMTELTARVRSKIERPPIPSELLPHDRQTGLLGEQTFHSEAEREIFRSQRSGKPGALACVSLYEMDRLRDRIGPRSMARIAKEMSNLISADSQPLDLAGRDSEGRFLLLLPEIDPDAVRQRLKTLSGRVAGHTFLASGERLNLTPLISFATFERDVSVDELLRRTHLALDYAASSLDIQPVRFDPKVHVPRVRSEPGLLRRLLEKVRLPTQIALVQITPIVVPFLALVALYKVGIDIALPVYLFVVLALLATAYLIWREGLLALRPPEIPDDPEGPHQSASAIIAAYLPNEAATVVETIEAFLRVEYPGPLEVLLAYNTPRDLPVEATLQEIARRDRRFRPLKVEGSTSKAQNVNAALSEVNGEFVGVFDADHHPDPDSFDRARRWLFSGDYDVVQGHCLVRNGEESQVARMVAVEFESIYAVSHPGRFRLHGFGVFGGSNGYWRTEALRRIRMQGFMLTEDIDSSLRAVEDGYKIASDPELISRELAPTTIKALWNQRMRWAQGWFQVSLRHLWRSSRSSKLSVRQKLGFFHLLGWREIYPWLSVQIFPIVAFWAWKYGGFDKLNWFVPIFVLTTLFTFSVGPGQALFGYLLAAPEIRKHRRWFVYYFIVTSLAYAEFRNIISRVAQMKEIMREKQWKVTPRTETKGSGQ